MNILTYKAVGLSQEVELQILLPREHLAMSGNIFGCLTGSGSAMGIWEWSPGALHLTVHCWFATSQELPGCDLKLVPEHWRVERGSPLQTGGWQF